MVSLRLLCVAFLAAACATGWAEGKKKPASAAAVEFAVVGGTVFRDNGLALADAEVALEVIQDPPLAAKSKMNKLKAVTSPRGEFTFRVPPAAMKYRVSILAKGFQPVEKVVEVQGGSERVDATFTLSPESKH